MSERILYHLQAYVKYEDKFEVPFDMTQDGVSQACGISRAHAAIEIKKMRASGLIEERLSHVKRGKMRRKIYILTTEGKIKATDRDGPRPDHRARRQPRRCSPGCAAARSTAT